LREDFVRSMSRRKQDDTKNTKEILRQEDGTAELGSASVTATSRLTLCVRSANETGRLTPSEEVHHIIPLSEGGTNKQQNLMALCKSCHSTNHAETW
jgi:5-methylcytosine-specific restriction endonuclease McrA